MRRLARTATGLAAIALSLAAAALVDRPSTSADAAVQGVRVLDTSGSTPMPCKAVDVASGPFVTGGCPAGAYDFSVALSIRTVFGAMEFGECTTNFDVTLAADGRLWLDRLLIGGTPPCNDAWPCSPPSVIALRKKQSDSPPRDKVPPWRGRLVSGDEDSFDGSVRFCIDTCVGRYGGDIDIRLVRHDGGWQMRASSAGVGAGSLEVDADWDLDDPADFDLAPRAS